MKPISSTQTYQQMMNAYKERNITAQPLLDKLAKIQQERKEEINPALRQEDENTTITELNVINESIPTIEQLQAINREIS